MQIFQNTKSETHWYQAFWVRDTEPVIVRNKSVQNAKKKDKACVIIMSVM